MKNFLSKRKILIFFLVIIFIIPVFLVFLNRIREKAEFEKIMNMNNNVIPEIYYFDMSERPEEIGDIKIEYVEEEEGSTKWGLADIANLYLPDANKAYTINTVLESNVEPEQQCRITIDHTDYEILVIAYSKCAVSVFPSGEVRVSSDIESQYVSVSYKRKNADSLLSNEISFFLQSVRYAKVYPLYPYRSDLIVESDNLYYTNISYLGLYRNHPNYWSSYSLYNNEYANRKEGIKRALITNKNGEPVALIDANNNGIFDTNIIKDMSWAE